MVIVNESGPEMTLELWLWMAAVIFLLLGAVGFRFGSRLDSADVRYRRLMSGVGRATPGRNRSGAIVLLGLGSVSLVAAVVVSSTG